MSRGRAHECLDQKKPDPQKHAFSPSALAAAGAAGAAGVAWAAGVDTLQRAITQLQQEMQQAACSLKFEDAARLRDVINVLMQAAAAKGPGPQQNELYEHWHETKLHAQHACSATALGDAGAAGVAGDAEVAGVAGALAHGQTVHIDPGEGAAFFPLLLEP